MDELRKVEMLAFFMELNERLGVTHVVAEDEYLFGCAKGRKRLTAYVGDDAAVWERTKNAWKRVYG